MSKDFSNLIFVDCEANGKCPGKGIMTEFGAVHYSTREFFHGILANATPDPKNPALSLGGIFDKKRCETVMLDFEKWIFKMCGNNRPLFVSDNPAFDWQWINYYFWHYGKNGNPFGHSARRISDFYAGLVGDFSNSQKWKQLRITPHDHNPVHDALGNVEAFQRILNGER